MNPSLLLAKPLPRHPTANIVVSPAEFVAFSSDRLNTLIKKQTRGLPSSSDDDRYIKELIAELMKYLYIKAIHADDVLFVPVEMVDHIWHVFVLDTREYEAFCQKYAGRYLHHDPTIVDERLLQEGLIRSRDCIKQYFGEESYIWEDCDPSSCG